MTDSAVTTYSGDVEQLPAHRATEARGISIDYVQYAIERGADLAMVEKLMDLQRRRDAEMAQRAFNTAMAAAKAEMTVIKKNKLVDFSTNDGKSRTTYYHEDLGEIARTVDPILAKHGLSYRFSTTSEVNQPIIVSCIVSHRDGHSETNTLSGPRDDSGKKNLIQQMGSTITYLQRYTLKAALGLASAQDDDGRSAGHDGPETITDDETEKLQALMVETKTNPSDFFTAFGVESLGDMPKSRFDEAVGKLEKKKRLLKEREKTDA